MKNIPIRSIQPVVHHAEGGEGFKIRSIAEVLAGKDMDQDLHRHDFYFILVVTKGAGIHEVDFVKHAVTGHRIFILRPGQVHGLHLKAGSEGYLLEFDKGFRFLSSAPGNELLRKAAMRNVCNVDEAGIRELCEPLQAMLEEYRGKKEGFETVMKANLEIFLIRYLRCRQHDQQASGTANPFRQEKLQEFLDLLEANIRTTKKVSAYAGMMHLSAFQLNAITKSMVGKTATRLIDDQVLLEAKRYLLATSGQVSQVAFELGYEDVSYFIRFFKKHTGQTPEAFRKNLH